MAYPTEPPVYPECGSNDLRSRAAPDYPSAVAAQEACMRPRATKENQAYPVGPMKPIVASLDDLHAELDALRELAVSLNDHLSPVLGPEIPVGANGTPISENSKFSNAIANGARKARAIRDILEDIRARLEF